MPLMRSSALRPCFSRPVFMWISLRRAPPPVASGLESQIRTAVEGLQASAVARVRCARTSLPGRYVQHGSKHGQRVARAGHGDSSPRILGRRGRRTICQTVPGLDRPAPILAHERDRPLLGRRPRRGDRGAAGEAGDPAPVGRRRRLRRLPISLRPGRRGRGGRRAAAGRRHPGRRSGLARSGARRRPSISSRASAAPPSRSPTPTPPRAAAAAPASRSSGRPPEAPAHD